MACAPILKEDVWAAMIDRIRSDPDPELVRENLHIQESAIAKTANFP
jgi:hypothetical protein